MKVSIMTVIGIENYGSLLQAFATQKKIEEYADDVQIINYLHNSRINDLLKDVRNPFKIPFRILRMILYNKNFSKLKDTHLKLSDAVYTCENDFTQFQPVSDIYCTGSDQIWNPHCGHIPFELRFLSFIPDGNRKFAFASSFGMDRMDEDKVSQSKKWIDQFECISVREDSGVKILKEQYGYDNPIQIVDPTLAMTPEFWRNYAPDLKIKGEYILVYTIYLKKSFEDYAIKLSKKTGLPIIRLCTDFNQVFRSGRSVIIPPVFNFISLIDKAKYVLTDSLHATAFSMNLGTEPICVYQGNSGRISSFLRLIGQEQRAIIDFNDFDVLNRPVDFKHVSDVLDKERKRVDKFLKNIFDRRNLNFPKN